MKDEALGMLLLGGGFTALVWGATRSRSQTRSTTTPEPVVPVGTWVFPVPTLGDRPAVISNPFKASAHLGVDIMFKRRDARDLIAVFPAGTSNGTPLFFIPDNGFIEIACFHDGVQYGLSKHAVDWGSAAAVCPAGTWVCRADEIAACDTVRPDNASLDYRNCSGGAVGAGGGEHPGWLADEGTSSVDLTEGRFLTESGSVANAETCWSFPVWCCWN